MATETFDPRWQITSSRQYTLEHGAEYRARDREHAAAIAEVLEICLQCRMQVNPVIALLAVRKHAGEGYNGLRTRSFARLLRTIDRALGRLHYPDVALGYKQSPAAMPNPNNGQYDYRLEIGNEGSLVLYVHNGRFTDEVMTSGQWAEISAAAEEAGADEVSFDIGNVAGAVLRIWWD